MEFLYSLCEANGVRDACRASLVGLSGVPYSITADLWSSVNSKCGYADCYGGSLRRRMQT